MHHSKVFSAFRLLAVAAACLYLPLAFGQGTAKPSYMHEGKALSITIKTNVPKASIMEDGLFVGHAGAAFDSATGDHELLVSAQGFVPRLIRVRVGKAAVTETVNLARVPDKNTEVEIDYDQVKAPEPKLALPGLPSLCAAYNRGSGRVARELMLECRRETLIDDFAYFGRSWLAPSTPVDMDPNTRTMRDALLQTLASADSEAFYWRAEELYAARPDDNLAATLAALSAASRRDCNRVLQIAMENGSYRKPSPGLVFVRGLCFEMAKQPEKAARLYLHLASTTEHPADLLYHLARIQAPVAATSAVKTLRICTKAHPAYYPCYEALAQVQTLAGASNDAAQTMALYHQRTRAALAPLFVRDKLDADAIRAAVAERPFSFELVAAWSVISTQAGSPRAPLPLDATLISEPALVKQLLPRLEDQVAPDTLTPVYAMLTRYFPNDPTGWIRLASAYRVGNRCTESLEASNKALTLIQDDRRSGALLVSSTECLVRLDRLPEAETVLLQVTSASDPGWKAYYNLGVIQERLGKPEAAVKSFELAMTGDMPKTIRMRVEAKVALFYSSKDGGKGSKVAAPPGSESGTLPTH